MAIPVPPPAVRRIIRLREPYEARFPSVRWLPAKALHVTLLFLGPVAAARVDELCSAMAGVVEETPSFAIRLAGGDGRHHEADGVAWLRVVTGAREALALAEACRSACPRDLTAGRREPRRSPAAHVTLARRADGALIASLRRQDLGPLEAGWTADRAILYRSHLGSGGAWYEALCEARLAEDRGSTGRLTPQPTET